MTYKFLRLSGYGIVTFCAMLLSGIIEITLARYKISNLSRMVFIPVLYMVIAAVFNHRYFVVAVLEAWHWGNQLLFVAFTLAIGLFPISFMFIVNRHAKHIVTEQDAVAVNVSENSVTKISENEMTPTSPLITLMGNNQDDELTVS
jgi:hypothetical protein